MMRRADWRERLAGFIVERRKTPMVWGLSDCCLTSADAGLAMTDLDLAAPLRGYSNRFGATRALLRLGHRSVESFLDSILPRAQRARAGDFVLVPDPPLDAVMIADGRGGAWGQDAAGLVRVAIPPSALFWSV